MWKWMIAFIGCIFLLQGCVSNDSGEIQKQEKQREGISQGVNEQLLQAADSGKVNIIRKLIKEGVNINAQDTKGRTATMIATYNNDIETAKVLIEAGADVNIQDNMKNNPFLYAGAEGYIELLKLTIDAGADPAITNRYGGTALIPASEHGYVDVVKLLLDNTNIDINHVNNLGWTALMEAIVLGDGGESQQETIKLLIEHGADINIPDSGGITPLQHAEEKGYKEIIKILQTEKFNRLSETNRNHMKEQFFQAANQGNVTMINTLLSEGIDINVTDERGRTAAMIATYANQLETVRILIEKGTDINIQDDLKNNPFLYAGAEGYLEILKHTIEAGADPKLLNRYGGTALIPASEHGYVDVVQELLEHTDVDVNHINTPGWTALLEAIVYSDGGRKHQETIKLLIEHGADVNIPDLEGVTPLQHAKDRGFEEIKEILLLAGAK